MRRQQDQFSRITTRSLSKSTKVTIFSEADVDNPHTGRRDRTSDVNFHQIFLDLES